MTFQEAWFSEAACDALTRVARSTNHLIGRVVEVGCWEGRSTVTLAHAVEPEAVCAVDTWNGSPGEISADLAKQRDVHAAFLENVSRLTAGNVKPYRESWRSFFEREQVPIRFLHIDAEHSYKEVRDNIEAARPLMVPGGVICGDDAHHDPVIDAVTDTLGDYTLDATLWIWRVPGGSE